jgi:colanic acid biosynthesis protein WcaH
MDLAHKQAMELLDSWAGDPSAGLPYELFLFISSLVPMVNVDLLIQDDAGQVLLTWRDDEIYGAGWHIPGGVIRFSETVEERIRATALEELGAEVTFDPTPVMEQSVAPARKVRGHHISLVYRCRLRTVPDESLRFAGGAPSRGQWAWHGRCPADMLPFHKRYCRFFSI